MSKVHIDKFVGQTHEKTYTVPGFLIGLADIALPRAALDALEKRGIDIPAINKARRNGGPYSRSVDIVERGVTKRVFVSLER